MDGGISGRAGTKTIGSQAYNPKDPTSQDWGDHGSAAHPGGRRDSRRLVRHRKCRATEAWATGWLQDT